MRVFFPQSPSMGHMAKIQDWFFIFDLTVLSKRSRKIALWIPSRFFWGGRPHPKKVLGEPWNIKAVNRR